MKDYPNNNFLTNAYETETKICDKTEGVPETYLAVTENDDALGRTDRVIREAPNLFENIRFDTTEQRSAQWKEHYYHEPEEEKDWGVPVLIIGIIVILVFAFLIFVGSRT